MNDVEETKCNGSVSFSRMVPTTLAFSYHNPKPVWPRSRRSWNLKFNIQYPIGKNGIIIIMNHTMISFKKKLFKEKFQQEYLFSQPVINLSLIN